MKHVPVIYIILGVLFLDICFIALHLLLGAEIDFFNLDKEKNLPTYYSGIKLLSVGLLVIMWASMQKKVLKWAWLPIGMLFVYLAADEVLELHEQLAFVVYPYLFAGLGWFSNKVFYWVLLFLPGILIASAYIYFFTSRLTLKEIPGRRWYYVGLACYLLVIAMEFIGGLFTSLPIGYHIMTLEESMELLGTTSFLYGVMKGFEVRRMSFLAFIKDSRIS